MLKAARTTFNHAGEEANHVDHIAGHFDPVVDRGLPSVASQFQLGLWS